jgi:hypothetical protein
MTPLVKAGISGVKPPISQSSEIGVSSEEEKENDGWMDGWTDGRTENEYEGGAGCLYRAVCSLKITSVRTGFDARTLQWHTVLVRTV